MGGVSSWDRGGVFRMRTGGGEVLDGLLKGLFFLESPEEWRPAGLLRVSSAWAEKGIYRVERVE